MFFPTCLHIFIPSLKPSVPLWVYTDHLTDFLEVLYSPHCRIGCPLQRCHCLDVLPSISPGGDGASEKVSSICLLESTARWPTIG